MADAFQKFKSSVNRGITTISVKSASALEKSKIKTHIDTLNKEIEKEFTVAGYEAYKLWVAGNTDFSSLFVKYELINTKHKEIEELNQQIAAIEERDNQILGSSNSIDLNTVPTASNAVPVETPNTAEASATASTQSVFCSKCGAKYDAPVKFCRQCGNKIAD